MYGKKTLDSKFHRVVSLFFFQNLQPSQKLRFAACFPFGISRRLGRKFRPEKKIPLKFGHPNESIRKRSAMHFVPFECNNRFQPGFSEGPKKTEFVGKIFFGDLFRVGGKKGHFLKGRILTKCVKKVKIV